jgi:putative ABC transport system permease protein|tara:strand:+ start:2028 stop:3206 length:1179 start_codon:yes stop_codon:yes gene_type:complete
MRDTDTRRVFSGSVSVMLRLVLRRLAYEPSRTMLIVTALASVIAVVLILEGFRSGLDAQLRDAVYDRHAPLFVVQQGVENFIGTRSAIPQLARASIEAVAGVASVSPLSVVPVVFDKDGRKTPILLVVSDGAGGPDEVLRGSAKLGGGRIVIDRSLSEKYRLEVDEPIEITGYPFRISGVASGAAAFFTPFAFIDFGDLIDLFWALDIGADIASVPIVGFLLVTPKAGTDVAAVKQAIEKSVTGIDVIHASTLAENDVSLGRDLFDPVLGVLLGVAYVTALVVVAIVMFSGVQARLRDYVVLYAVGVRDSSALMALVIESVILMATALPCALAFSWVVAQILDAVAPLYRVLPLEPDVVFRTGVGTVICGIAGGLMALRLISRIDPSEAFKQ